MERILVLLVLCSGFSGIEARRLRLFNVSKGEATWNNSQVFCNNQGESLITLYDEEDANFTLKVLGDERAWLGLRIYPTLMWSDGTVFQNQDLKEKVRDEEGCLSHEGQDWNVCDCSQKKDFVCKKGSNFRLFTTPLTWCKAMQHCSTMPNATLASISNDEELEEVTSMKNRSNSFWVGLMTGGGQWEDGGCSDLTPRLFRNDNSRRKRAVPISEISSPERAVRSSEISSPERAVPISEISSPERAVPISEISSPERAVRSSEISSTDCVEMNRDTVSDWPNTHVTQCDDSSRVARAVCSSGTVRIRTVKEPMKWELAYDYCKEHHSGLLMIEDEEDQKAVEQWLKYAETKHDTFWIGLRQSRIFGFWIWKDRVANFYNWFNDEAPEPDMSFRCAEIRKNDSKWSGLSCLEERPFLCQEDIIKMTKTTPQNPDSSEI